MIFLEILADYLLLALAFARIYFYSGAPGDRYMIPTAIVIGLAWPLIYVAAISSRYSVPHLYHPSLTKDFEK